jgi:hypothetical protein
MTWQKIVLLLCLLGEPVFTQNNTFTLKSVGIVLRHGTATDSLHLFKEMEQF